MIKYLNILILSLETNIIVSHMMWVTLTTLSLRLQIILSSVDSTEYYINVYDVIKIVNSYKRDGGAQVLHYNYIVLLAMVSSRCRY